MHLHFSSLGIRVARLSHISKEFPKPREYFCPVLYCIEEPATGKNVERNVKLIEDNTGHAYVFPGEFSGRSMRLGMNDHVRLVIASDTVDEMNALIHALQIRISPWQLVYRCIKEIFLDEKSSN